MGLMAAAAVLVVGTSASPSAAAMDVILMRHGDKDVQRGDYNLSPLGFQRAVALATLIPACFGKPDRIITFVLDPNSSRNARSYQTAVPLAVATGVNIRIDEASRMDSFEQGQRLRQDASRANERVVVFWQHERMPALARGLGWDAMPAVAGDDFDQLILFRLAAPGAVPQVQRYSQRELVQRPRYRQGAGLLPGGPITPPITPPVAAQRPLQP
jgi:phosphohistidine phosphatase SixA